MFEYNRTKSNLKSWQFVGRETENERKSERAPPKSTCLAMSQCRSTCKHSSHYHRFNELIVLLLLKCQVLWWQNNWPMPTRNDTTTAWPNPRQHTTKWNTCKQMMTDIIKQHLHSIYKSRVPKPYFRVPGPFKTNRGCVEMHVGFLIASKLHVALCTHIVK